MSHTGQILYARWDYIDRDAVTHQNLWASRPDGTNPIAVWGNATPKPHCTFQAQPIPGSSKIVFTASAHHSITAGPIASSIRASLPTARTACERITPEIRSRRPKRRHPGVLRRPVAAVGGFLPGGYSPYPLDWEPLPIRRMRLGIYLLDRWGNRELIYRDPEIGSTNPCPPRPVRRSSESAGAGPSGDLAPPIHDPARAPPGRDDRHRRVPRPRRRGPRHIKELRVVQIFPKTTPVANQPPIGMAGEENGRAMLGTVPVEPDGSARFLVPAGKPFCSRPWTPTAGLSDDAVADLRAARRAGRVRRLPRAQDDRAAGQAGRPAGPAAAASEIEPGPWGGRPFSYVEVVQPVLDRHCVRCHGGEKTEGGIDLTGEPRGLSAAPTWP